MRCSLFRQTIFIGLMGIGFAVASWAGSNERRSGVYLPDESTAALANTATAFVSSPEGVYLAVPLDPNKAWSALDQTLRRLGIAATEKNRAQGYWATTWVMWVYDPGTDRGTSKPGTRLGERIFERHQFAFAVKSAAPGGTGARIQIADQARQRQVDITPDSEYTWLEWQAAATQPAAAAACLRRIHRDYESVVVTTAVTTEATAGGGQMEAQSMYPGAVTAPVPPRAPVTDQSAAPRPPVQVRGAPASMSAAAVEPAQRPAQGRSPLPRVQQPRATPTESGLFVRATPDHTWRTLIAALEALGVTVDYQSPQQRILVTDWVNGSFDRNNKTFELRSKKARNWAFNWRGRGIKRHRFKLAVVAMDSGPHSMVRVDHLGFQEQIDETPDSSQTILVWQDRPSSGQIALAFLHRLRLTVEK
ncbi:MAG: hypothetical protein V3R51_04170 [Gammaproteobacteria bacterium]